MHTVHSVIIVSIFRSVATATRTPNEEILSFSKKSDAALATVLRPSHPSFPLKLFHADFPPAGGPPGTRILSPPGAH